MKLAVKVVIIFDLMILSINYFDISTNQWICGILPGPRTKNADDYLVAGRKTHPSIMAISHGATLIITAAMLV